VKNKARYEFDEPESCSVCDMRAVTAPYCKINDIFVGCHTNRRHPDCPLKIVPETPEGELKPCPFCGGKAIMDYIEPHTHSERLAKIMPDYKGGHFIECTGCTCALSFGNDRNAAIAAWNRREG